MEGSADFIGRQIDELDTPCLLVDLDLMEENIRMMAESCRRLGIRWRPHTKTCKVPALAYKLIDAGAEGICVAKLAEAEVMAAGGVKDILITSEIVGALKVKRVISLTRHFPLIKVVVDNVENIIELSSAASDAGLVLDVLLEINVGQNRCGVEPGQEAVQMACRICESPGLRLRGVQGYEGHLQHIQDESERKARCLEALSLLVETARKIDEQCPGTMDIVTTAGTGTYSFAAQVPGITEVQPGSFLFMDASYRHCGVPFRNALSVLSTVISKSPRNWVVVDAGLKALSIDEGMAEVKDLPRLVHTRGGDEHGILKGPDGEVPLRLGQKLEFLPGHCDTTVNLYDWLYGVRERRVEMIWQISGRGKTQ